MCPAFSWQAKQSALVYGLSPECCDVIVDALLLGCQRTSASHDILLPIMLQLTIYCVPHIVKTAASYGCNHSGRSRRLAC